MKTKIGFKNLVTAYLKQNYDSGLSESEKCLKEDGRNHFL